MKVKWLEDTHSGYGKRSVQPIQIEDALQAHCVDTAKRGCEHRY
jgi:hypothetical protein